MTARPDESAREFGGTGLNLIVARNLRRYREAMGLSQEAFADRSGFHRTYVSAIERGRKNLSLRGVERLAEQLHLDALDLLREERLKP